MKEKVRKLEAQLHEIRAEQRQQHFPHAPDGGMNFVPEATSTNSSFCGRNSSILVAPASLPRELRPGIVTTSSTAATNEPVLEAAQPCMAHLFARQHHYSASDLVDQYNYATAGSPDHVSSTPSVGLPGGSPMQQRLSRDTSAAPIPKQESLQVDVHCKYAGVVGGCFPWHTSPVHNDTLDMPLAVPHPKVSEESGGDGEVSSNSTPWLNSPSMASATSINTGTFARQGITYTSLCSCLSSTTAGGVLCTRLIDRFSSIEERLAYVLRCAQDAGFDTFDSMAAQFYASKVNSCRSLSMD
ncbi:hypothetical protein NLG97_g3033 [Lecanicillium saksenae]|uniref:Uncharacterized protein n=1 Tax=Lecanicillium saksenae TaxID=468837 RepID=A0ACC1R0H6_9HYPO|nr:hypothetical protein NLG97_g3033 [Lecanicillium saksenae]